MKRSREFLVGSFTLTALVILAAVTVYLRNWDILNRRATYYVLFKQVSRLEKGSPVLVSGIEYGQVTRLNYRMNEAERVRVTIQLSKEVQLYSNAHLEVDAAPVLGDTTLNIDAGHPGPGVTVLAPNSEIAGVESTDLTTVMAQVSADLRSTLQNANEVLSDPQNKASLKATLANLSGATAQLNDMLARVNTGFGPVMDELTTTAQHMNGFLVEGQGLSARLGTEVVEARKSIQVTAGDISQSAQSIAGNFKDSMARLQQSLDTLNSTLQSNQQALHQTLTNLDEASHNLNDIVDRVGKGQGTLGRLITDSRPFEELHQLISTIGQSLTGRQAATFPLPETASPPLPTPAGTPRATPGTNAR